MNTRRIGFAGTTQAVARGFDDLAGYLLFNDGIAER